MSGSTAATMRAILLGLILSAVTPAGAEPLLERAWTDKSQYRPGDPVVVSVALDNTTGGPWTGTVAIEPCFLGTPLGLGQQQAVTLPAGAGQTLTFSLSVGDPRERGYLVEITCVEDGGGVTDRGATSFDFADDWTRFPRYGFLTQFDSLADAAALIDPLRDYRINAIQYYDWMDEHHVLVRPDTPAWQDIATRPVSRAKLNELIDRGRDYNIAAMAYTLMYGAYDDYETDSAVSLSWGMFDQPRPGSGYTRSEQDRHELGISGWETQRLYLFRPSSQNWRDWLVAELQAAAAEVAFDGWHIDTLGDRGTVYRFNGVPFDLAASYPGFVGDLRTQLGPSPFLTVNAVSRYGLTQLMQSPDLDVVYAELWNEAAEDEYFDLLALSDTVRAATDTPLVIAGYLNYDTAKLFTPQNPARFKKAAILMADAVIFANGGWHLELGDGEALLSSEYFPNQSLTMTDSARRDLLDYYNFAVAYENLLRDGTVTASQRIDYDLGGGTPSGYGGAAGEVWKISKYRDGLDDTAYFDIAHLINLQGAGTTLWRDPASQATIPTEVLDKPVRVYFDNAWGASTVWHASPDYAAGAATQVTDYTLGFDAGEGREYVEFTLPALRYWTMVWLARQPQTAFDGGPLPIPGRIEAEDFDTGGEGFAYHDCDASNNGGAFRTSEGVDLEACSEGGFNIGWICAGEWIEYTVGVRCPGPYLLEARVASGLAGGTFHLELDGTDVTGPLGVPATGDWQNWVTISTTIELAATGTHVLRFVNDSPSGEEYNLNWWRLSLSGDTNGDDAIDLGDLANVLAAFGNTTPGSTADINRDGVVDLSDLAGVLARFGVVCE